MTDYQTTPGPGGGGGPPINAIEESFFKSDLYESTLTLGISSNRFDRAVRKGLARRVPTDFTGHDVGIKAAMQHRGRHQSIITLPLGYAMATRLGPDKVFVDLHYRRGRVTLPTQPEKEVASFRGWHEHVIVYRKSDTFDKGLPAGDLYFDPNQKDEPTGRAWRRPVIRAYVSHVLFYNPFKQVGKAIGKVNPEGSRFVLGGYLLEPRALRLDSVDTDWIEIYDAAGNVRHGFITDYVFTIAPQGWYEQVLTKESGKWDVDTVAQFDDWGKNVSFPFQSSF